MAAGRTSREVQIQQDLIEQQNLHGPVARNVSILAYTMFAAAYWQPGRTRPLALWLGLQALVIAVGLAVNRAARMRDARTHAVLRLKRLPVLASGIAWAAGYPVLLDGGMELETLTYLMFLVGMTAGATVSYSLDPWSVAFFAVPAMLPLAWFMLEHAPAATPVFLLFGVSMVWLSRTSRSRMLDVIRLGYQNRDLLDASVVERAAAESANASKARFLAAASHDLRQPVQAVALLADALGEAKANGREAEHVRTRLNDAVTRLSTMVEAMLDLSRVDAGGLELRPAALGARPLLYGIADALQRDAAQHDSIVVVRGRDAEVWADAVALRRVVQNLAENAVRHGKRGGLIILAARARPSGVELQVWDDGPGIPEAMQSVIFDEFAQLGNSERNHRRGLGLGLSMVRAICDQCGWALEVRSREGHGSMFSVHAPRPSQPTGALRDSPDRARGTEARPPSLALWLIEDDADVRTALAITLEGLGCTTRSFVDGEEALEAARAHGAVTPDLLLSDLRLPGRWTGRELVRELRLTWACAVPAILLSGDAQAEASEPPVEEATVLLTKPVSRRVLASRIRQLHETHLARR